MNHALRVFNNLPANHSVKTWKEATDKVRKVARNKSIIAKHLLTADCAVSAAFTLLKADYNQGVATVAVTNAINALGKLPSAATVYNWCKAYKAMGLEGLIPQHKGKAAIAPAWAARCITLYHTPNSWSFAMTADELKLEGFKDCTHSQVRRFINSLGHELGPQSPYRIGRKLYSEKHKDHKLRSTESLGSGFMYNGDGHTIDCYVAHPVTGNAYRPELTLFQDVHSRCVPPGAWEISAAESAISTLTALTRAIRINCHVPAMLYLDNGSGYINALMNDETAGVYEYLGITPIFAIPGNARVKWIERFFLHMEDRVSKRFATYCGRHHDDRYKRKMLMEVKQGKRQLPTLAEWIAAFLAFLDHYHNSPHPEIAGKTRQQVWDEIDKAAPDVVDYEYLPRAKVNIRRGRFTFDKRTYAADMLHTYNGQQLIAAYDMQDDARVKVHNLNGDFLQYASLKLKSHVIPNSRIEEAEVKRLHGQKKRLNNKLREVAERATETRVIDVDSVAQFTSDDDALDINEHDIDVGEFIELPAPAGCDANFNLDHLLTQQTTTEQTEETEHDFY
jgi:putative transposase